MSDEASVRIPVCMLWDAVNCPKPSEAKDLVRNVNKVLQEYHKDYYVAKIRVCSSDQFISEEYCKNIEECDDVKCTIVPKKNQECHCCNKEIEGAGDQIARTKKLVMEMFVHAIGIQEAAETVILVVSGDDDLMTSVQGLVSRGCIMLTAVDEDATKSYYSEYQCAWKWADMKDGVNNKMLWNRNNMKDGVSLI